MVVFLLGSLWWRYLVVGYRWLLPPQRRRCVPWGVWEIWAALFLVIVFWPAICAAALTQYEFFTSLYGPDFPSLQKPAADDPLIQMAIARRAIWVAALSFPLKVASVLIIFHLGSGTRPYQLGLTWHRGWRNILLGFLAFLIVTPLVYGVYFIVFQVQGEGEGHLFTRLFLQTPIPIDLVVLVFSAVVAAPVTEELLFRGVLQSWLGCRSWGGTIAVALAFLLALAQSSSSTTSGWRAWAPVLFVLAMLPGSWMIHWLWRSSPAGAIYGTALLFAAGHEAWPHPIPLFVLGLALGWLAYRTQSLVAPIVLHSLFNSVACVQLLLTPQPVDQPLNGRAETTAERRLPSDSTSSAVPGSWLPRRTYANAIGPNRGDTTEEVTWPTSVPSRNNLAPGDVAAVPSILTPTKVRLTWPRSRAMTIGSCPR